MIRPSRSFDQRTFRTARREQREELAARAFVIVLIAALVIAVLVILAGDALAADDRAWTGLDTALQLTYTAVTIADWTQTLHIARNPGIYYETNPHLGRHPSEGRVNSWFAGCIALNAAIAAALPHPYRNIWQSFWIGYEYTYVESNINIGLKLSF